MRLSPIVLSPLSKHVAQEYDPLNPFMLQTAALASRSTVQVRIIPRQRCSPSGVCTIIPSEHNNNNYYNHHNTLIAARVQ